jgi:hypothetical protein
MNSELSRGRDHGSHNGVFACTRPQIVSARVERVPCHAFVVSPSCALGFHSASFPLNAMF